MRYLVENFHGYDTDGTALYYAEISGPSSETKPVVSSNGTGKLVGGSLFFETDTGSTCIYDETGSWNPFPG